jgi:cytochrome c peroxidase
LCKYLFYDKHLSINGSKSCGSCHAPQFSFTDGYRRSVGALGDVLQRNAPPLVNLAYNTHYTWANDTLTRLEQQIRLPLFAHNEMGLTPDNTDILRYIATDSVYKALFSAVFPHQSISYPHIVNSLACFVRTLVSHRAPYDDYIYLHKTQALTASQLRGEKLFLSKKTDCVQCHSGINFNMEMGKTANAFFNIGLYNIGDSSAYPTSDTGLQMQTKKPEDMGKFRVPTLRNLAFTAPYLHDGSVATLTEIIDIYANGGGHTGVHSGGDANIYKDKRITGFMFSAAERTDLLNFLMALSDSNFVKNPAFQNPY